MEHVHIEDLVTLMQRVSQELSTYGTIKVGQVLIQNCRDKTMADKLMIPLL